MNGFTSGRLEKGKHYWCPGNSGEQLSAGSDGRLPSGQPRWPSHTHATGGVGSHPRRLGTCPMSHFSHELSQRDGVVAPARSYGLIEGEQVQ